MLAVLTLMLGTTLVRGAPGDVDAGFNPSPNGEVMALAVQPDGKIIIGGSFTSVNGITRNRIARLHGDGSLDLSFNPTANGTVNCIAIQADGKIVIGGNFSTIGGVTSRTLVRLNSDGTRDLGFNAFPDAIVEGIAIQQDYRILITGWFNLVNNISRNYCARLNSDGTLDIAYDPDANQTSYCSAVQNDGRILLSGQFSTLGGITRNGMGRFNVDGTVDASFNRTTTGVVQPIALQADGMIIIGGGFSANGIMRLNVNGSKDTLFTTVANGRIRSSQIQADGKIVIGGQFTQIDGQTRNRIARLNSDGTLDSSFNPNANSNLNGVALQPDGKILVAGVFTAVGGVTRNYIARLENASVTQSLAATSTDRVEWLRGGTSSETQNVSFDLSSDGGGTWTALGVGTRISGGWELGGLSLPASGHVRARAFMAGGRYNGSISFLEIVSPFPSAPEIAIEQPLSVSIEDGGSRSLGVANVDASSSLTFTIKNTGNSELTGIGVTIDGPDAEMFSVTASPATTISGPVGSSTFTVQFAPTSIGTKTAVLHIASNDSDEGVFDITITGSDPVPEIAVQQPVGTDVSDGGTMSMTVALGGTTSLVFTIQSTGTDSLTGLVISKDGTHASEFMVTTSPVAPVAPNGSTTFTVVFNPTAGGTRNAALHIASNDADESPFDINLSGMALSFTQDADNDGMSDAAEFQLATLGFNWQVQQTALVSTYFANANGNSLFTTAQIQALNIGTPLLLRDPNTGAFTLTIGIEKSTDLSNFNPFPLTAPQTIINAQGKLEFQFTVPDNAAFFKVQAE